MKKIACLIMPVLLLALVACGGSQSNTQSTAPEAEATQYIAPEMQQEVQLEEIKFVAPSNWNDAGDENGWHYYYPFGNHEDGLFGYYEEEHDFGVLSEDQAQSGLNTFADSQENNGMTITQKEFTTVADFPAITYYAEGEIKDSLYYQERWCAILADNHIYSICMGQKDKLSEEASSFFDEIVSGIEPTKPKANVVYSVTKEFSIDDNNSLTVKLSGHDTAPNLITIECAFDGTDKPSEKAIIDVMQLSLCVYNANINGTPFFLATGQSGGDEIEGTWLSGMVYPDGYGAYAGIDANYELTDELRSLVLSWADEVIQEAQAECPHDFAEATCEKPRTCNWCNLEDGEPLGHTTDNGVCERCGKTIFAPMEYSGSGDYVLSNIEMPKSVYTAHITHSGSRNFAIWAYSNNNTDKDLLVNTIGNYDGVVLLPQDTPISLNISADGAWTVTIEQITTTTDTTFTGVGDYVTPIFQGTTGAYKITHNGSHNFVVRCITNERSHLIVNEIGSYEGVQMVEMDSSGIALFEINADGAWSIERQS